MLYFISQVQWENRVCSKDIESQLTFILPHAAFLSPQGGFSGAHSPLPPSANLPDLSTPALCLCQAQWDPSEMSMAGWEQPSVRGQALPLRAQPGAKVAML